jgi:chromate transporter
MKTDQKVEGKQSLSRWQLLFEIFIVATRLGITSFGGPIAHLGYFREEYVKKRRWIDEQRYADLVALCQFLPGPASSQVGIALGTIRGGLPGGIVAWIGFTFPSVLFLVLFAYSLQNMDVSTAGWIHGLKIVAVAVVAQAIWGMGKSLTPDKPRIAIAVVTTIITLLWPTAFGQILLIISAGIAGLLIYKHIDTPAVRNVSTSISRKLGISAWILFFALLLSLPLLRQMFPHTWIAVFDSFYRVGSLVFGGGHVVLPLLEREVVPTGWVSSEAFLAGYGAAQAVPGPLFTFAGYLGAVMNGWSGAFLATIAIFLPSFFLVIGTLPFWETLRKNPRFQAALLGVNAAVVGILLAALYNPVWTSAIKNPIDFGLALLCFALLMYWKVAPWIVVLLAAVVGHIM